MPEGLDLDAYFQRIGYAGPRTAALETLAGIILRHTLTIPFENLDPLLKRPVQLDLPALERKLVHGGRGGWCYEQNLLLKHALESLGFSVTGLAARVMWGAPVGTVRARTHMLLRIDLGAEPYVADVGFGGFTLTGPLRLATDIEQPTPHETFRLVAAEDDFVLEAQIQESWKPVYCFDLQPQRLIDYELTNWYLQHHPESPFVTNLMVARVTPDRRYGLFNNKLETRPLHGESSQRVLSDVAELRDALANVFNVQFPDDGPASAVFKHVLG